MLKKFFMLFIIFIAFFLTFISCSKKIISVEFETEVIDFGTINAGDSRDLVFRFKNTGTEDLKIWEIRPTCGCTEPDDWDKVIEPGGTGSINIKFYTQAFREDIIKVIYIKTNVPDRASIQLTIKGYIHHTLEINPKAVYIGDVMDVNKPIERSFRITNNQGFPLRPSQIIAPDENTTINLVKLEEERKYDLEFTVNPPFVIEEEVTKKIIIKTGKDLEQTVELEYSYFVPPPIQVSPKKIELDMEKVSMEKINWRINIRSNIDKPISVLDLYFDGTGVEVFVDELLENKFYQIALLFPLGFTFPDEQKLFYVTFKVQNDPKGLVYKIPIEAAPIK